MFHYTEKDPAQLAQRLKDADALILTQQRTRFTRRARGTDVARAPRVFRGSPAEESPANS